MVGKIIAVVILCVAVFVIGIWLQIQTMSLAWGIQLQSMGWLVVLSIISGVVSELLKYGIKGILDED